MPYVISDVVVVLPGIMGSTLAHDGSLVWAPSAGSVLRAIKTFGNSIHRLTLSANVGDECPGDGVEPVALMPDLHLLPGVWSWNVGYGVLLDWLRARFHLVEPTPQAPDRIPNLLPVPYDWRLSNRYNGRRIKGIVETALERWQSQGGRFADAKLIFVCHSMGGLVARWYIEREGGAEITRKLITLGTPFRGAVNALDQLVNGVRKGIGRFNVDLTSFARSLPSLHQLLPEYACVESPIGLLKCTEVRIPELDTAMAADGMRFHDELDQAAAGRRPGGYAVHPFVGFRQKTFTTTRVTGHSLEAIPTIGGEDIGGDGTVPSLSAIPKHERADSPTIRWIADQHGSLQSNRAALDELEGILTAQTTVYRAAGVELGVRTDPILLAGEEMEIEATVGGDERQALLAHVVDERGAEIAVGQMLWSAGGIHRITFSSMPPGAYKVIVGGVGSRAALIAPVTAAVLVWSEV